MLRKKAKRIKYIKIIFIFLSFYIVNLLLLKKYGNINLYKIIYIIKTFYYIIIQFKKKLLINFILY